MLNRAFSLFFCCLLFLSYAQAASLPAYPVKPAKEYVVKAESAGLTIAVVPMEEIKEQRTYFGANLRSRGMIPVFVVIENHSSSDSFLLDKEALTFANAIQPGLALTNPANPSAGDRAVEIAALAPYPQAILADFVTSQSKKFRQDLLNTELKSGTLSPGTSMSGFVFIPERAGYSSRQKIHLVFPVGRSGRNDVVTIDVEI